MYFKSFKDFKNPMRINEGLFDKLFIWMNEIGAMFKNPDTIQKSVESVVTDAGQSSPKNLVPKNVAIKETYFIIMGDGKDSKTNFSLSITKMADLFDGSGLFSITGTTNPAMLKALVGSDNIIDLNKNSVMAIVSKDSFIKGKPITIKILKNMLPGGKDYVSEFQVTGIAPGTSVQEIFNKNKSV